MSTLVTQILSPVYYHALTPLSKLRSPWLPVGLLWCVCFLNYADRQAIFVLFPLLRSGLGLSTLQLGAVGSAFMWMYACFGPVAGWLGDRWSKRRLILGGVLLWTVLAFVIAFARNFAELVFLRALSGLCEAFYFPAAMSLLSEIHGPKTRSRALAIHQSAVYVGSIGGGALSGWLGEVAGWRSVFVCFASTGLAVSLGVALLLRGSEQHVVSRDVREVASASPAPGLWTASKAFFSDGRVLGLAAVFIGANFVAMVFATWFPTYLHDAFHMSLGMSGLNGTLYLQLAAVGGVVLGGFWADALASRRAGGRIIVQAAGLFVGAPFVFITGWTHTIPVLLVALAGFGLGKGIYDSNLFASLYDLVPANRRASAAGLLNSLGWLGGGFAPLVVGLAARRFGLAACLLWTSLLYFVLAFGLAANLRIWPAVGQIPASKGE